MWQRAHSGPLTIAVHNGLWCVLMKIQQAGGRIQRLRRQVGNLGEDVGRGEA